MASPPEDTTTSTPRRTISREMKRKRKGTGDGKSSSIPLREEEQKHHKSETAKGSCTPKSRKNRNEKVKTCKWDLEQEVEIDSCLPGQRYKTLDQREPFRIFLETLYQKLPEDELPALWMMEWGLLPYDEAKKACERNLSKKLCKMESEVEDTRSSSLSQKNVDFASRTVSKTKKQKTHNNTTDGAVSEPSSGRNKQQKKKHKEKIINIEREDDSSKGFSKIDSLSQAIGKEHPGRVRGVGSGPCPTQVFGQTSCSNAPVDFGLQTYMTEMKSELEASRVKVQNLESIIETERSRRQAIEGAVTYILQMQGSNLPPELAALINVMAPDEGSAPVLSQGARPSSSASHDAQQLADHSNRSPN
ncbi:uncharacterized protein LOC141827862 isoform X2 [Curcuma longa]|uniref:uncharacterized protein LOC141827862 isoform X2 n=1 Tax=Curcuma longa TaxID=136217 RepID=UPI003D9E40FD